MDHFMTELRQGLSTAGEITIFLWGSRSLQRHRRNQDAWVLTCNISPAHFSKFTLLVLWWHMALLLSAQCCFGFRWSSWSTVLKRISHYPSFGTWRWCPLSYLLLLACIISEKQCILALARTMFLTRISRKRRQEFSNFTENNTVKY